MNNIKDLHCGACMSKFDNVDLLRKHLRNCPEAEALLPLIYIVSLFNGDKLGHPLAHFINCFHKATKLNLIKKYSYAVADETNVMERAKIHTELCDTLGFKYKEFRPFESSDIKELMNRKESLKYLCQEISLHAHKLE